MKQLNVTSSLSRGDIRVAFFSEGFCSVLGSIGVRELFTKIILFVFCVYVKMKEYYQKKTQDMTHIDLPISPTVHATV